MILKNIYILFKFSVFEESKMFIKVMEYILTDKVMCNVGGNILGILTLLNQCHPNLTKTNKG